MLIDIQFKRYLGYNKKTKLYSYEFELTDGEFGSVVGVGAAREAAAGAGAAEVIAEYSKRNLNVAANLVKLLLLYKRRNGWEIAEQIEWWQKRQPLFTTELKTKLDKLLLLT